MTIYRGICIIIGCHPEQVHVWALVIEYEVGLTIAKMSVLNKVQAGPSAPLPLFLSQILALYSHSLTQVTLSQSLSSTSTAAIAVHIEATQICHQRLDTTPYFRRPAFPCQNL